MVFDHPSFKAGEPFWYLFTPEEALEILCTWNTHNRERSPSNLAKFVSDMLNKRWARNHVPIIFAPNHTLIDGSHRLQAVFESGLAIEFFVAVDPIETQVVVDTGKPRCPKDALTLDGRVGKVTNEIMSTLGSMLRGLNGKKQYSVQQLREMLARYKDAIDWAMSHIEHRGANTRGIATGPVRAVIARAWFSVDLDRLRAFCDLLTNDVITGVPGEKSVLMLRRHLQVGDNTGSNAAKNRYAKTERALAAYLDGEDLSRLFGVPKELYPIPGFDDASRPMLRKAV